MVHVTAPSSTTPSLLAHRPCDLLDVWPGRSALGPSCRASVSRHLQPQSRVRQACWPGLGTHGGQPWHRWEPQAGAVVGSVCRRCSVTGRRGQWACARSDRRPAHRCLNLSQVGRGGRARFRVGRGLAGRVRRGSHPHGPVGARVRVHPASGLEPRPQLRRPD